eukprot:TRINITY_DN19724_c0_g1_i2.p1 TRINITY_DN19724_c0_g1~~TRINITY_DN19724_c0_g1_i2.p1  ORF type:complete len:168 (-),score=43.53 TRINITY_DN19724_c0_g1_i2:133-636(-)
MVRNEKQLIQRVFLAWKIYARYTAKIEHALAASGVDLRGLETPGGFGFRPVSGPSTPRASTSLSGVLSPVPFNTSATSLPPITPIANQQPRRLSFYPVPFTRTDSTLTQDPNQALLQAFASRSMEAIPMASGGVAGRGQGQSENQGEPSSATNHANQTVPDEKYVQD